MSYSGIARFDDVLSDKDARDIYGFLVADRRRMKQEGTTAGPVSRFNDILQ